MGFFNARTKKKGNGCPEADTPQVKNPEMADVVIHIVDDARTEKAAGFLRYLKPRQGPTASAFTSAARCTGNSPVSCGHWA